MEFIFDDKDGLRGLPLPRMEAVKDCSMPEHFAVPSSTHGPAMHTERRGVYLLSSSAI